MNELYDIFSLFHFRRAVNDGSISSTARVAFAFLFLDFIRCFRVAGNDEFTAWFKRRFFARCLLCATLPFSFSLYRASFPPGLGPGL